MNMRSIIHKRMELPFKCCPNVLSSRDRSEREEKQTKKQRIQSHLSVLQFRITFLAQELFDVAKAWTVCERLQCAGFVSKVCVSQSPVVVKRFEQRASIGKIFNVIDWLEVGEKAVLDCMQPGIKQARIVSATYFIQVSVDDDDGVCAAEQLEVYPLRDVEARVDAHDETAVVRCIGRLWTHVRRRTAPPR